MENNMTLEVLDKQEVKVTKYFIALNKNINYIFNIIMNIFI